ncbi:MAG: DNA-directed RNA polymerase subunit omega [Clostridia bacterium]|nr:DNA-directed RNA polymerase subunit omega [Clostridia bacterium]
MNQPPLDLLLQKISNKYSLVVKTAKRARKIAEGEIIKDENGQLLKGKPVTLALYEIAYKRPYPLENGNHKGKRG